MALGDFLARWGGREGETPDPAPRPAGPPTSDDLLAALAASEELVHTGDVPSVVTARVERITRAVRDTIPRLSSLAAGSDHAYSVVATATDYLPEAVGGYRRLPRRFADTRPVDGAKTSLMVLVDQLDLLGATMDQVFDAVCRDDARALVVHGRFLQEKFGRASSGGDLDLDLGATAPGAGAGRPTLDADGRPAGHGDRGAVVDPPEADTAGAAPAVPGLAPGGGLASGASDATDGPGAGDAGRPTQGPGAASTAGDGGGPERLVPPGVTR